MNKILILFILIITNNLHAQVIESVDFSVKNHLRDYHLKGKVKEVISEVNDLNGYTTTLPFLEHKFFNKFSYSFNTNGLLTQIKNYLDYKGKLEIYNIIDFTYLNNLLVEQKNTVYNNYEDPVIVASLKTYNYNNKGELVLLKNDVKTKNSNTTYSTEFIYDKKLSEVVNKVFDKVSSRNKLFYSSKGSIIKEELTTIDGKKGLIKKYMYDGDLLIYKEEEVKGKTSKVFFDNKNNVIQYYNSDLRQTEAYNYNEDGLETRILIETYKNNKPTIEEYELKYSFDKKGNWINCQILSKNKVLYIVSREISYY